MIPEIPRDNILQALEKFDQERRSTSNWQNDGRHGWAIHYDGKYYPDDEIIHLATEMAGIPISDFTADEAQPFLLKRGFNVVPWPLAEQASPMVERLAHALETTGEKPDGQGGRMSEGI